jgi:dephospho-CoA kinase
VGALFAELGALVVDADRLTHEAQQPGGAAYDAVVRRFGPGILDETGDIDRGALGALVFGDPEARRDLERILHPAVRAAFHGSVREHAALPDPPPVALFDAALLVESGYHRELNGLVVVHCKTETQIARLLRRDGLDRTEAERRIAVQAPLAEKLAVADWTVDTDGSMAQTRLQVERIYRELTAGSSDEGGG